MYFCISGRTLVSIHAPTRGATLPRLRLNGLRGVFQSTLPRGERHNRQSIHIEAVSFNPRSHEGSDINGAELLPDRQSFNPRSHEGSDKIQQPTLLKT